MAGMRRVASSDKLHDARASATSDMRSAMRSGHRRVGQMKLHLRTYGFDIRIPNDLWGAATLALQLSRRPTTTSFKRAPSPLQSSSPTTVAVPWTAGAPEYPQDILDALDLAPTLTLTEDLTCFLATAAVCLLVWFFTAPPRFSPPYAIGISILGLVVLSSLRSWLLERHFAAVQRIDRDLAGPGSEFVEFEGVSLHVKRATPQTGEGYPKATTATTTATTTTTSPSALVHCLHGFGAGVFSWSYVQKALAHSVNAVVTAHDMPGFGLSQRPNAHRPYSLGFNAAAATAIVNGGTSSSAAPYPHPHPKQKRVLIGHSMGGAAVAEAVIQQPDGVDALVLVAPAIVALWTGIPAAARGDTIATGAALLEEFVAPQDAPGALLSTSDSADSLDFGENGVKDDVKCTSLVERSETTAKVKNENVSEGREKGVNRNRKRVRGRSQGPPPLRILAAIAHAVFAEIARLFLIAATPLLVATLRNVVRNRAFWERGLAAAWYDKSRVTPAYVNGYRLPQLVKNWEYGILSFLRGRFGEKAGLVPALKAAIAEDGALSQAERLAAACKQHGIKVLIIHGENDALVPLANSRRLAKVLPGARVVEFEACGHMPHEECPEKFVAEVAAFVQGGE
jgi:pimeloyl-ACP methyl ester carboxylesterase